VTDSEKLTKTLFEVGLSKFYSIMVFVKYHPLVVLPGHLKSDSWIAGTTVIPLEYGLDMPLPIDDLKVVENGHGIAGVSATLSFSRVFFATFVPWDAVVAIEGGEPRPVEKPKFKLKLVP